MKIVRTILSDTSAKNYKEDIFQPDNGTYGFELLKWSAEDTAWIPFGKWSHAVLDSEASVISEVESRFESLFN